jgi:cytochrome P450
VHRNPRYWPTQASKITNQSNDLNDFRPERWLAKPVADSPRQEDSGNNTDVEEDEDFEGFTGQDTSAQLFRPTKGSYLPFSDGPRSCLGRRLAQVKIMAVLAVIFQNYSIELAVDEWATDDEVAKMSNEEKRELYSRAQQKAKQTIRSATTLITLKLHPGFIPVRMVKIGEERFVNIID